MEGFKKILRIILKPMHGLYIAGVNMQCPNEMVVIAISMVTSIIFWFALKMETEWPWYGVTFVAFMTFGFLFWGLSMLSDAIGGVFLFISTPFEKMYQAILPAYKRKHVSEKSFKKNPEYAAFERYYEKYNENNMYQIQKISRDA